MLWTIEARDDDDDDDMVRFDSELDIKSPLTKAKWMQPDEIVVSTMTGDLIRVSVKRDAQNVPFLEKKNKMLFRADSAIMDIALYNFNQTV